MIRDSDGNTHLTRVETAAAIKLWLEHRGGYFIIDEDARIITCEMTGVDLSPLTESEFEGILLDLAWEIHAILRAQAGATVH